MLNPTQAEKLDAVAFHLAECWYRNECPDRTPAEAERWAARQLRHFRSQAAVALAMLAKVKAKKARQALRGLPDRPSQSR